MGGVLMPHAPALTLPHGKRDRQQTFPCMSQVPVSVSPGQGLRCAFSVREVFPQLCKNTGPIIKPL